MDKQSFSKEVLFEHELWLQAMGDHGKYIKETLSPGEKAKIQMSSEFIQVFDELLEQSRKELNEEQIYELTKLAFAYTEEFNKFMQSLIREHFYYSEHE